MLSLEGIQKRADDTWEPKDEQVPSTGAKVGERIAGPRVSPHLRLMTRRCRGPSSARVAAHGPRGAGTPARRSADHARAVHACACMASLSGYERSSIDG